MVIAQVWEIPPTATVLAYSEKTRVEAFAVGEHALGIQGHPEYTVDILHNLIDRLTDQNDIQRSVGEEARRTAAETGGPDRAFWTALCKGFLRGEEAEQYTTAAVAGPPPRRCRRRMWLAAQSPWPPAASPAQLRRSSWPTAPASTSSWRCSWYYYVPCRCMIDAVLTSYEACSFGTAII